MNFYKKYLAHTLIILLFIIASGLWYKIYAVSPNNPYLKVVFLDVGQGDSIYIETPDGHQMLIDGGVDGRVLSKLSEVMPYGDRSIDVVLATHADKDHIGGLSDVLDNFQVDIFIENGVEGDTSIYKNLEQKILNNKIKKVIARRGNSIVLDKEKNIHFDILFPDRDVTKLESNEGSIIGKLIYNNESFLFTGDAPIYIENLIRWNESDSFLKSQVLKLGHHGARTASSLPWLESVKPDITIVSAGKDNQYGHPSKEVLDRLADLKIPYLATYNKGNIVLETDGVKIKSSQL
jgi:competence protein ComEC